MFENQDLYEFIIAMLEELDGGGMYITDQDLLEKTINSLSDFIENNIQIKEQK